MCLASKQGRFFSIALVFCIVSGNVNAQRALPKGVQADLLQQEIKQALEAKDLPTLLDKIQAYRRLGVTVPPPLISIEAKALAATGDFAGAVGLLEDYFQVADRESDRYREAIELYFAFQEKSDDVVEKQLRQAAESEPDPELRKRLWEEYENYMSTK